MTTILFIFILFVFLAGCIYYVRYSCGKEGLTTMNGEQRCPNILIQKGAKFYLYNSKLDQVPGVNPVEFNNLEDYVEFIEWQHGAGIRCPVLYLQNTYDIQGNRVYKVRPSVTELQGGLPPSTTTVQNAYQSFDNTSQYVNPNINPLVADQDQVNERMLFSDNAMDDNWGGQAYTEQHVEEGKYAGDEVSLFVP